MAHYVYILYSPRLDRYYVGETENVDERLSQHLRGAFPGSFTKRADDWRVAWQLTCQGRQQARKIEAHIKRMKSKDYIKKMCLDPEKGRGLLERYNNQ